MSARLPLPDSMQPKVAANTHPGLALDKYVASWDPNAQEAGKLQENVQKPALEKVARLSQGPPDADLFRRLVERRHELLGHLNAQVFFGRTTGPLTLHLSRASVLENAGLCLHPVYGFAYLTGSGLKGMARAYATTVWLPAQPKDGKTLIDRVFGGVAEAGSESVGSVVFHDAWPESWPKLGLDIVNNHHPGYYEGRNEPGDWEDPVPVYFISVLAGARFQFAISLRRDGTDPALLRTAMQWLEGALVTLGAGAKTNAGYGAFEIVASASAASLPLSGARCDVEVELVTPGFFAGPLQGAEDCELRPATLRGLLRWWWRTLHAGYIEKDSLRRLESAIWGNTKSGGAVRLTVKNKNSINPVSYDFKSGYNPTPEFKKSNALQDSPDRKTSQGLFYISYGMAEKKRWYVPAGSAWSLCLAAKETTKDLRINAEQALEQAKAALWMLCRFGGVGAKCRKGFGSMRIGSGLSGVTLDSLIKEASMLRKICGLPIDALSEPKSPSIDFAIMQSVPTPWTNYWYALDQLGFAAQVFAKRYKHNVEKRALGLPRKIGPPTTGNFRYEKGNRHASPVHFHFSKGADGKLTLDILAFPSAHLPDFAKSQNFIRNFTGFLVGEITNRSSIAGKGTLPAFPMPGAIAAGTSSVRSPGSGSMPRAKELVEAVLLDEKTKKGGWKAKHESSGLSGAVVNHELVPSEAKPGDRRTLIVAFISAKEIQFRVPTAAELTAPSKTEPAGDGRGQRQRPGGPRRDRMGPR